MTERSHETGFVRNAHRPSTVSLSSALFLTALVIVGLSALAFWPAKSWSPPNRPGIAPPIVFDEFVNPAPAVSTEAPQSAP